MPPLLTDQGCYGLTLKRTCLVFGIVYLVLNFLLSYGIYASGMSWFFVLQSFIFIIVSISLLLAVFIKNKYFCLPWCAALVFSAIAVFVALFNASSISHPIKDGGTFFERNYYSINSTSFLCILMYSILRLLAELVILRYALSYYVELGGGFQIEIDA